jgi:hypothetical protein
MAIETYLQRRGLWLGEGPGQPSSLQIDPNRTLPMEAVMELL